MGAPSEQRRTLWQASGMLGARLLGLGLTLWGLSTEVHPGFHGVHLGAWVLILSGVPAWILWADEVNGSWRRNLPTLGWLALTGGVLAAYAQMGYVVVGTAALGAAIVFDLPAALALGACGPVACAITVGITGRADGVIVSAGAATLAGLMLGSGRRASLQRARQQTLTAVEHERAEIEQARADVLAERNRLAREVHDVLAHTLGALAVQLEALGARAEAGSDVPDDVRRALEGTRALAVDGLVEARSAVQALRDDAEPLEAQLQRLAGVRNATLSVSGGSRALSAEATHALYRVAQESLTNAAKHAPDAPATVRLAYDASGVTLRVENGPSERRARELAATGGGFGLDAIRERIRLLGGEVGAGPDGEGWAVTATVPQ